MNNTERKLILLARKLSKPSVFFHGTTTKFLPSILKNGLDPSKIKEGNWREDKSTNHLNISKVSYGGVYFARSAQTAMGYANDLHRKQDEKYKPLIVATQISEHSLIPDEDHYTGRIRHAVHDITRNAEHITAQILASILIKHRYNNQPEYDKKYSYKAYFTKFQAKALESMGISQEQFEKRQDKKRLLGIINGVLIAECKRHLAHLTKEKGYNGSYTGQYILNKGFHEIAPKKLSDKYFEEYMDGDYKYKRMISPKEFKLPTPEKGELDFKRAMDRLIHVTKNHPPGNKDNSYYTARKFDSIGFKGRNRITALIQHDTYNRKDLDKPDEYTVLYGTPPEEFIKYAVDRSNEPNVIWKDKTGKIIGHNKDIKISKDKPQENNPHEWWHALTKDEQTNYIKEHPNSRLKISASVKYKNR